MFACTLNESVYEKEHSKKKKKKEKRKEIKRHKQIEGQIIFMY